MDSSFTVASRSLPVGARFRHPAVLATLGLLMVLVPYAALSSTTPFPGAAAISPVIGTALLIRYGSSGWVSRLLAWRPLVATGKISYSLYLWHWPVTVFWKYAVYDQLYWFDYIGMVLLSFLLGYLSWKFVELPVRTSQAWTVRRCFIFATTGIVLLGGFSIACVFSRGWPTVLHPKANSVISAYDKQAQFVELLIRTKIHFIGSVVGYNFMAIDQAPISPDNTCKIGAPGPPEVLLVGDSHAGALQEGVDICLRNQAISGCAIIRSGKDLFCLDSPETKEVLTQLAKFKKIKKVLLVQRWLSPTRLQLLPLGVQLEAFANHIKKQGITLFIATDVPTRDCSPVAMQARRAIIAPRHITVDWDSPQSEEEYNRQQGEINKNLEAVCRKTGAILIPPHLALRQGDHYIAVDNQNGTTVSLYKDGNHLSSAGSLRTARFIMPYLFPETNTQGKDPNPSPDREEGDCAAHIPAPIVSEGMSRGTNESITPSAAVFDSSFTVASPP